MGGSQRRSRLTIVALLGLVSIGASISAATPAAASGIAVYVGYADSLRADPTNFPTPWFGSPNTVFEGCAPVASCVYDAGAVRIVNNTNGAVTVNAVAVHVSTCTFSGWAPAIIAPGAELVITQTAAVANDTCAGPAQLDGSDIGPGGASYTGQCTPDGIRPTVDITINGTTTTYTDSGQVLNTGGFDTGLCNGNESTQWTLIGTGPCRGSSLTLTPLTQNDPLFSTATVTAQFSNSCGQGLSNTTISFNAIAGINSGLSGTGVTDVNGKATFTYSSQLVGTDTWEATIATAVGSLSSNTALVNWTATAPGAGGAFVISDLKDGKGGAAYWWGAQWWKNDPLSSGSAPASFKGYENGNTSPWCGDSWTTRPGNSSKPPKAVAPNSLMPVIVSSQITKSGAKISGDIVAIVIVRTNAGYAANPGHPGTGTIVDTLCRVTPAAAQASPTAAAGRPHGAGQSARASASNLTTRLAPNPTPNDNAQVSTPAVVPSVANVDKKPGHDAPRANGKGKR